MEEGFCALDIFPLEIWLRILGYLGPCSLLECAQVDHDFCELAHDERLWLPHAQRVKSKLGLWAPLHDGNMPLWRLFKDTLLCPLSAISPILLGNSICWVPNRDAWHVRCYYLHYSGDYQVEIENDRMLQQVMVRANDHRTEGLDVRALRAGITCTFDRGVNPGAYRRFHAIVRGNDAAEPRDERVWLKIIKLV
jgi:hypothetical protein